VASVAMKCAFAVASAHMAWTTYFAIACARSTQLHIVPRVMRTPERAMMPPAG
jgi:hypothetical protein